jgi:hypothetical protein
VYGTMHRTARRVGAHYIFWNNAYKHNDTPTLPFPVAAVLLLLVMMMLMLIVTMMWWRWWCEFRTPV